MSERMYIYINRERYRLDRLAWTLFFPVTIYYTVFVRS